jgi:flagellar protein FliO/FliZ
LPRNKKPNRRLALFVVLVAAVAITGLFVINVEQVTADKAMSEQIAEPVAEVVADSELSVLPEGDVVMALIKMVSALLIVIGMVYGALFLLRRLMGKNVGRNANSDILEVLQTTCVGQHKAISLVKVANRSVLVGVTDHQVSLLSELNEAQTAEILASTVTEKTPQETFAGILSKSMTKIKQMGQTKTNAVLETQ